LRQKIIEDIMATISDLGVTIVEAEEAEELARGRPRAESSEDEDEESEDDEERVRRQCR
jgi:ribosomal protein L12E/L44/L45/RPP1/RPP2